MKFKTTKKEVLNFYPVTIQASYCSLQNLLSYRTENAYTSGTYGWNADIYFIENIAICTGYRPFGTIKPTYDIISKYDKEAERILYNHNIDYETKREKIDALLKEFIREVKQNDNKEH